MQVLKFWLIFGIRVTKKLFSSKSNSQFDIFGYLSNNLARETNIKSRNKFNFFSINFTFCFRLLEKNRFQKSQKKPFHFTQKWNFNFSQKWFIYF